MVSAASPLGRANRRVRSKVGLGFQGIGVPATLDVDLRRELVEVGELGFGEDDVGRFEVLL